MTGSAHLNAPSYLPTLLGSGSYGNSLLATLHGYRGPAPSLVNPLAALEQAQTNEARQVALVAAQPQVRQDIAQFTQALAMARTPAQLLAHPVVLKVLLTANGLADQAGDNGLARQALLSDPAQSDSFVNQLADSRWLRVNQTYSFAAKGLSVLNGSGTIAAIANGYAQALWRTNLDRTTPGLSNALDFVRRASTITNVNQVLGDPTFSAVITTALGVSLQTGVTAGEQAISTRIDLTQFKNPAFVTQFARRFLIAAQQAATQTTAQAAPSLAAQAEQSVALVV